MMIGGYVYGYEVGDTQELQQPAPVVQLPAGYGYELEEVPREIPEKSCSCGIYALRSRAAIACSPYGADAVAVGAVSLWGKIIPGKDGFRAQYAYPLVIYTDLELEDYGVPVLPRNDLARDIPVRRLLR
jgi:hypothetical protein